MTSPGAEDGNGAGDRQPPVASEQPTREELLLQIADLRAKLTTLPAIEQAKGALMAAYGLTPDAAFALLRWHSQHTNVKLRSIATELTGRSVTGPMSGAAAARLDRLLATITSTLASFPTNSSASAAAAGPGRTTAQAAQTSPLTTSFDDSRVMRPTELPQVMVRAVSAAAHGITIATNADDRPLVYSNDAFQRLTGYPMKQILGQNCRFLQGPDTDPHDVAAIAEAVHTGTDVSRVILNYRQDGSRFWNEVTISAVRDDTTGVVTHLIGTQSEVPDHRLSRVR